MSSQLEKAILEASVTLENYHCYNVSKSMEISNEQKIKIQNYKDSVQLNNERNSVQILNNFEKTNNKINFELKSEDIKKWIQILNEINYNGKIEEISSGKKKRKGSELSRLMRNFDEGLEALLCYDGEEEEDGQVSEADKEEALYILNKTRREINIFKKKLDKL